MSTDVRIESSWKNVLEEQFEAPYWGELSVFVKAEYQQTTVYPPPKLIFNAFDLCPFEKVKVVILGQDPYFGKGQAHGLCFSVPEGMPTPPSLANIYKEIESDTGAAPKKNGNLEHWATQGVLLLNATLTVRAGQAGSHQGKGWEQFTTAAIQKLSEEREHIVFLLWGRYAKEKKSLINWSKHLVLTAAHPSPLSAHSGFFGCKHFSKTNEYLRAHNQTLIEW